MSDEDRLPDVTEEHLVGAWEMSSAVVIVNHTKPLPGVMIGLSNLAGEERFFFMPAVAIPEFVTRLMASRAEAVEAAPRAIVEVRKPGLN